MSCMTSPAGVPIEFSSLVGHTTITLCMSHNLYTEEGGKAELVELRAFVRKGGKLKYELDGLRWKTSYAKDGSGEGPPPGILSM